MNRELSIPPKAADNANSRELLRAWFDGDTLDIAIEIRAAKEPEAWGILLADITRHVCKAYGTAHADTFVEDTAKIIQTFLAELSGNDPEDDENC